MGERACFRAGEIQGLTGLTDRQIGYYVKTGLVKRSAPRVGGRMYSWRNLFELLAIAALKEYGVSVQALRGCFPGLREWLGEFPVETLRERTLAMLPFPGGLADVFLVEAPGYAKRLQSLQAFVMVDFSVTYKAVMEKDAKVGRGVKVA